MSREPDFSELSSLLHRFGEALRAHLASLRSAAETLDAYPKMDRERRLRLQGVVLEESARLSEVLELGVQRLDLWCAAHRPRPRMAARELVGAIVARLREAGRDARAALADGAPDPEEDLQVAADAPALAGVFERIAAKLADELGVREVTVRLGREPGFATLDLIWECGDDPLDTVMAWQSDALSLPSDERALSIPDLARRHGGEAWFNVRPESATASLRILLPLADEPVAAQDVG